MALIRVRLQKALPLLQHQHVQKTTMVLFHLLFQISKEKLLCSLQSLPTLLSLYHEGFACSHLGVSSFWFSCFHVNRDTPSLLLHTTPYTTFRVKADFRQNQHNPQNESSVIRFTLFILSNLPAHPLRNMS